VQEYWVESGERQCSSWLNGRGKKKKGEERSNAIEEKSVDSAVGELK
jgi:hypothetical protein